MVTTFQPNRSKFSADSRFASSQWETVLLGNNVSQWLGASLESALKFKWLLDVLNQVIISLTQFFIHTLSKNFSTKIS